MNGGILGEKIGRKAVLSLSLLIMGIVSGLIGLLPSCETIGIAAPILLVILRILQGFGASAELGSAIAVAYEYADERTKGRFGALPALDAQVGLLGASLAVTGVTSFGKEFLYDWGWRISFVASFAVVGVGYWIRRNMPETPDFERVTTEAKRRKGFQVFLDLLKLDWRGLAVVAAVYGGYAAISYTFKTSRCPTSHSSRTWRPTSAFSESPWPARRRSSRCRASGLGAGREVSGATAGGRVPLAALAIVTVSPTHATWGVSLLIIGAAVLVVAGVVFDQKDRVGLRIAGAGTPPGARKL